MRHKYTKEIISSVAKKCDCISDMLRMLGIKQSGGNHGHMKKNLTKWEIDTSHFVRWKRPLKHGTKKHWEKILTRNTHGRRTKATQLRRALIESGVAYECVKCGCDGTWRGEKITLEVHHKNNDWLDNTRNNLQFMCPNCHSQTTGFSVVLKEVKENRCLDCEAPISKYGKRCKSCAAKHRESTCGGMVDSEDLESSA